MKVNLDCVRDVLITCEDEIIMDDNGEMNTIHESDINRKFPSYTTAEIKYTIKYLSEFGLIDAYITSSDNVAVIFASIYDLTPTGHEFLENIKNDTVWAKTKSNAVKVGSFSLGILKEISIAVLTEAIKAQMI